MSDVEPGEELSEENTLARATTLLGEPDALFRANPRRLRLKFLLATALLIYGIVANVLWFGFGPCRIDHLVFHFLFVPPAIGTGLLWHMWRHRGLRVLLYPTGLLRLQHGEADSFPWEEITAVKYKLDLQGQPHIERDDNGEITCAWLETSAPTFQVWNVWLEVTRADGVAVKLTAALADFPDLVERVQRRTYPHLAAKIFDALARNESVSFSEQIVASRDEIRGGKITVPWNEARSASISGRIVIIKRKGSWIKNVAGEMTTIANLHVLFALAASHGLVDEDKG